MWKTLVKIEGTIRTIKNDPKEAVMGGYCPLEHNQGEGILL